MSDSSMILFAAKQGDSLSISVHDYTHPESNDFWDGNWIVSTVTVAVGDFKATIKADLRLDELNDLRKQLKTIASGEAGYIKFETLDGWLEFEITLDDTGKGVIRGMMKDSYAVTDENSLRFTLRFDALDISARVQEIDDVLNVFPVRGTK